MVTQKPISLKIDYNLLEELDAEVSTGWRKRNNLINEAIRYYLELQDATRRVKTYGSILDKEREAQKFIRKWFPEVATW